MNEQRLFAFLRKQPASTLLDLLPQTAATMRRLALLHPKQLALMHGPMYHGECELALQQLADCYATRLLQIQSSAGTLGS